MLDISMGASPYVLKSYFTLNAGLVDHLIDIVGRDSGLERSSRKVQHLSSETAHFAHPLLLLLIQDLDTVLAKQALLGARNAITSIIRVGNRLRDSPLGRQGINWSQRAGVLVGREGVELAGSWIRFRNYLRRKEIGEGITFLVDGFVLALYRRLGMAYSNHRPAQGPRLSH